MVEPIQNITPPLMGIGEILGTTFKVYRSQFGRFFLISFRAHAWILMTVIASTVGFLGIIAILFVVLGRQGSAVSYLILGLAIIISAIAWIGFYLFSLAKFLANSALISKLTFNLLTNSTESPSQSSESLKSKTWAFFRISLYVTVSYLLLYMGFWIVGGVLAGISAIILGVSNADELAVVITFVVFGIGYILATVFFYIWLFARWFVPEVVLAVEEITGAVDSIGRSWDLSKSSAFKLILVAFIGFLITAPIATSVSFLPIVVTNSFDATDSVYQSVSLLASLLNICISLVILPFWQTIKGVLYYDMRVQERKSTFAQFK